jgi:hypothetical protein
VSKEVITRLTDDLDGSQASATVYFALDDSSYEIDLSDRNAAALRKALDKYIRSARPDERDGERPRVQRRRSRTRSASTKQAGRGSRQRRPYDAREVREWATANGLQVSSRGRVPAAIVTSWQEAQA